MSEASRIRTLLIRCFFHARTAVGTPARLWRRRNVRIAKRNKSTFVAKVKAVRSRMIVDPDTFFCQIYINGSYEPGPVKYIRRNIKSGMTCVDIGANVGYFTLLMAALVAPMGRVYSFEPSLRTFAILAQNLKLNRFDNVYIEQKAIANRTGTLEFHVGPAGYDVYNSAGAITHPSAAHADFSSVTVPCMSLDHYLHSVGVSKIDLLKLDVEGAEWLALQGMENTLRTNEDLKLIIEFSGQTTRGFGYEPSAMAEWLLDRGHSLFFISSTGRLKPVKSIHRDWTGQMVLASKSTGILPA